ncbi:3-oxoacyl-ACP reductase [Amycolatopsis sp. MJM2582]|uniref:SDR family NAD(P)-dependent oxidoreductase n=1 Tax=Amycolatopsis sp. MJM2582 TaxID=1427749 RepID=UPI000504E062|nr:SDR family NAD(P)-dependent oxidoreductase [Amycolatopsis sp. MJM2582]KFZ76902.1 3-oxoacyl-ACP reductase [Amycolatopsis sp. MJM2582]
MRLKGKIAVVTGGTKGIGRRIAERFLAEGARVVGVGRDHPAEPGGDDLSWYAADVRDQDAVRAAFAAAADQYGALDIVVAAAGLSRPGPVATLLPAQWREVLATNVDGTFHCIREAAPLLEERGGGRIITLSSALASRVAPGAAAYSASKAAVEMLTKVAAVELAPKGIAVNCLAPGIIDEGMGKALIGNAAVWQRYRHRLASGRPGRADEVAESAVFLAAEDTGYVNGAVLEVNGGLDW